MYFKKFCSHVSSASNAGDLGSISRSGRCPGEGMATLFRILAGEFHAQRSLLDYSL